MLKILKKWQKRIEKNAFKSTLTYVDKNGVSHTETVYFKRSLMPLGDWQRIYPPVDENGKINRINLWFGGWRNLVKFLIIMFIVGMVFLQFQANFSAIESWKELAQLCNQNLNLKPM